MKPFLVLVSFFAAANAGISGFGSGSGFSANSAGYTGGGISAGSFSNGGYSGGGNGFSGAGIGGFGGGISNNGGGISSIGGGISNIGGGISNIGGGISNIGGGISNIGGGFSGGGDGSGFGGGGGQIRKFVSVHVGPEEPQITQTKVIRAGGVPDKHVNIIFVKAPSASNHQNTEVILPEVPQQKTLVYVLVKKQESSNNVRVRGPAPTRPSKPEVYFIRYKDSAAGPGTGAGIGGGFTGDGSGSIGVGNPNAAYGPPLAGGAGVNVNNGGY